MCIMKVKLGLVDKEGDSWSRDHEFESRCTIVLFCSQVM